MLGANVFGPDNSIPPSPVEPETGEPHPFPDKMQVLSYVAEPGLEDDSEGYELESSDDMKDVLDDHLADGSDTRSQGVDDGQITQGDPTLLLQEELVLRESQMVVMPGMSTHMSPSLAY
jgi:hypothetical protein